MIKDLNAQLFKIYVTMPDDGYERIRGAISPRVGNIGQFRDKVLVELRKARFSDTQYTEPCDIRYFQLK